MTFESLPWPAITAASGGWALLAIAVWAIISGRLVPRSVLDDALHDRNEWRAESRIKDQQIAEKDNQLAHLRQVGETQIAAWRKVREIAEKEPT